jgi:hypothetical protein
MITSYGETSGFTPVSCDETQAINGGSPWNVFVAMAATLVIAGVIGEKVYKKTVSSK